MRTLGRGKREKEAVSGAFQWSRGEAPKAALRLSPTFAAVNGQRMKPHAVSATIKARAKPHATAWRMLSKSPLGPERPMRPIHSANRQARRPRDEKPMRTKAPEARTGELASRRRSSDPYAATGREAIGLRSRRVPAASRVREGPALRPKGGCKQTGAKRIPPSRH